MNGKDHARTKAFYRKGTLRKNATRETAECSGTRRTVMWKHKKAIIRIVAWLLILGMVAVYLINIAFAEQAIPSTPPQNITVTDIA